jgi:hypothetical protein
MLYPVELRAPKKLEDRPEEYPVKHPKSIANHTFGRERLVQKKPEPQRGSGHGRYKTRTCDLHDVNVAL